MKHVLEPRAAAVDLAVEEAGVGAIGVVVEGVVTEAAAVVAAMAVIIEPLDVTS